MGHWQVIRLLKKQVLSWRLNPVSLVPHKTHWHQHQYITLCSLYDNVNIYKCEYILTLLCHMG